MAELNVLSWNLFHGRDAPPDPNLTSKAWRFSRKPIDNGSYLNVNSSLLEEFAAVISAAPWSICLLQEAPPAWAGTLARQSKAEVLCSLTSRNQLAPLTRRIARRRPDLLGSWEGGSNVTLVRPPWHVVTDSCRTLLLNPLRERCLGERRRIMFARLRNDEVNEGGEICVANLHAGQKSQLARERQVLRAAEAALDWALGRPLLLGGDFNLRPKSASDLFERLEREFELAPPTASQAIDHLLARGLRTVVPPCPWPDEKREIQVSWDAGTRRIRLSDHAPIAAVFSVEHPRIR